MRKVLFVRVGVVVAVGLTIMVVTYVLLRPLPKAAGDFKFMHCDTCRTEMVYNTNLAWKSCPRCQPPKMGTLIATRESIHEGGANPWRRLKIALSFESVCLLGAVVFLLYHPPKLAASTYRRMRCPTCKRVLRFPPERAGGEGMCPACNSLFGYPLISQELD